MSQRLHRLHPPGVSGEPLEERGLFPVGHKRLGERLLDQGDALKRPVRELAPELLKPPLRRVEFRGVGREPEEADVLRMRYALGAMARCAVEDDEKVMIGVSV